MIWANTCCSHPFENESAIAAGERRLSEELGFSTTLSEGPSFVYRALDPNGRGVEHEHVTILTGTAEEQSQLNPDPNEVAEAKWMTVKELQSAMQKAPESFAPWFHLGLKKLI